MKTIYGQAAQRLIKHGISVFPLQPKMKKPFTGTHGVKDATADPEKTTKSWNRHPNANIGIATGASGFLVIDIDGDQGEASYRDLQTQLGDLPDTVTVITPGKVKDGKFTGKGRHLYFRNPPVKIVAKTNIVPKIDIRTGDTYVVAPPSVHPDGTGTYEFETGKDFDSIPVAELPQTWIDGFLPIRGVSRSGPRCAVTRTNASKADTVKRVTKYLEKCEGAMQGSNGHATLLSVANALVHGFELDPITAASIAWERYNPKCSPPRG